MCLFTLYMLCYDLKEFFEDTIFIWISFYSRRFYIQYSGSTDKNIDFQRDPCLNVNDFFYKAPFIVQAVLFFSVISLLTFSLLFRVIHKQYGKYYVFVYLTILNIGYWILNIEIFTEILRTFTRLQKEISKFYSRFLKDRPHRKVNAKLWNLPVNK